MRVTRWLAPLLIAVALPPSVDAQSLADHIAMGDSARAQLHSADALKHYQAAVGLAPTTYEANWKAAREIADVAKQLLGDSLKTQRDSLYSLGQTYAEAALKADSTGANGHYVLALVLGRLSRTRGGKERVRFAKIIYDEAARTVQIDPTHDAAYHILGIWHAEVKRLSGFTKFFAKTLFGAGFMDQASWDSARVYMEKAVALNPQHIYHRLELAGVYLDLDMPDKAEAELQAIAGLPTTDPMDHYYREQAAAALADLRAHKADDAKDLLRKG
ncbi:MAG TPA: tetratricopeptide repeat protein [Gemmatimonadales bacterium]|nr:tetratricopeptide repeat protein [Gemmatimonadales bacterium]